MARFVIQEHNLGAGKVHWDLMLEEGESLRTWRVEVEPGKWGEQAIRCERIFDHRLEFLSYEGPISGGRGEVHIADKGEIAELGKNEKYWKVRLQGDRMGGVLELCQAKGQDWKLKFQGEAR